MTCQEEFIAFPRKRQEGKQYAGVRSEVSEPGRENNSIVSFEAEKIYGPVRVNLGVQQEKIETPGPSRRVRVVPRSLPHFRGVHTGSPAGPVHGTEDQSSSGSGWVCRSIPILSMLAGCP